MPKAIAGTAYIKVDGQQFDLRGNLKVNISPVEREGKAGLDKVHGFTEKPVVPYIEGDFGDRGDLSITDLQSITDATVTAELVNGKNYLLRNAWVATAIELDGGEGQFTVKFEGVEGEELPAS